MKSRFRPVINERVPSAPHACEGRSSRSSKSNFGSAVTCLIALSFSSHIVRLVVIRWYPFYAQVQVDAPWLALCVLCDRDAVLGARASTGEPLYALSCLFLACFGGPEEAGAPPDMLGKSKGNKNKVSSVVEGAERNPEHGNRDIRHGNRDTVDDKCPLRGIGEGPGGS